MNVISTHVRTQSLKPYGEYYGEYPKIIFQMLHLYEMRVFSLFFVLFLQTVIIFLCCFFFLIICQKRGVFTYVHLLAVHFFAATAGLLT